jgi:hypothetical protein
MKLINLLKQSLKEYDLKKPTNIYASGGEDSNDSKESLKGKTINLIRSWHTTDKYNPEKGEMNKVTKDENLTGEIGTIDDFDETGKKDHGLSGFWLMNPSNGKKMGYVMWDDRTKEFVEGNSSWHYTYKGKSSSDQAMLDKFKK